MAEAVRHKLEEQIDELHDYKKLGIFDDGEIREIVKRRKAFEYALRRRQSRKIDFARYIEYETNVEALRVKRKKARNVNRANRPSDYSIIQRLHGLYTRALEKFKGDLPLWLQYFDFCESHISDRRLSRALAKCLQFHSTVPAIWVRAAKFEFEANSSVKAARIMLQRGLRLNPDAEELWIEYLRLELLHWEKLRRRALVLGVSADGDVITEAVTNAPHLTKDAHVDVHNNDSDNDDMAEDEELDADQERQAAVDMLAVVNQDLAQARGETAQTAAIVETSSAMVQARKLGDDFLSGVIPRLVANNLLDQFKDDVKLYQQVLDVFRLFPGTRASRGMVYERLGQQHARLPTVAALSLLAAKPYDDVSPTERLALLPAAVHALVMTADALFASMGKQHKLCPASVEAARIEFLSTVIAQLKPTDTHTVQLARHALDLGLAVVQSFQSPSKTKGKRQPVTRRDPSALDGIMTAALRSLPVGLALGELTVTQQLVDGAVLVADDLASHRGKRSKLTAHTLTSSEELLEQLFDAQTKLAQLTGEVADDVDDKFDNALEHVKQSTLLWGQRLKHATTHLSQANCRVVFRKCLQQPLARSFVSHVAVLYLRWECSRQDLPALRATFQWLSSLAKLDSGATLAMAEVELAQAPVDVKATRSLFETSLGQDATDHTVWLEYLGFELQYGNPSHASQLQFRATQAVSDPEVFQVAASRLLSQ